METETRLAESTGRPDQRFAARRRPTISFRLTPAFLDAIDAAAARKGITRTALIDEAIRLFLAIDTSMTHTNGKSDE